MPHVGRLRLITAVLVAALLAVTFASARKARAAQVPPQPQPATATGSIPVIAISPVLCLMLVGSRPGHTADALSCLSLDADPAAATRIADIVGDGDGTVEPSDFATIDLDANQIHQQDDWDLFNSTQSASGSLFVLAFVTNHGAVQFSTDRGVFVPYGSPNPGFSTSVDPVAQVYNCDSVSGGTPNPEDTDCDPTSIAGNGVVVARLRARYGDIIADLGPGTVSVTQGPDAGSLDFRVVGEPATVELSAVESKIQDGVTLTLLPTPTPGGAPTSTPTAGQLPQKCQFGDAVTLLAAGETPERAVVTAVVKDADGTAITGAIVNWVTDDRNKGVVAAPIGPTLDAGALGIGAPNILCGTTITGTVTVKAATTRDIVTPGLTIRDVDPNAAAARALQAFTVVGVPATITLAADPPSLPCDGVASSALTATVADANGDAAPAGQHVTFSTDALAAADPTTSKTDDNGAAKSSITPVGSDATGVPVVVTAGDASASITITCLATPTPTPTNTATPTPTPTSTDTPTPTPTDTPTPTATATPTDTPTPTATTTATPTATATGTSTPTTCTTTGQRISLVLGILRRMGAREGSRRYEARFDLNHDRIIDFGDLLLVLSARPCRPH